MWPFIILIGLFALDILLIFTNIRFLKQLDNVAVWINEKQQDLINIKDADTAHETIQAALHFMGEWSLQSKNIIIPGILFTQLITAYVIGSILDKESLSTMIVNLVAFAQAGVIVSALVLVQRIVEALKMTHLVNDEVIKVTVMREADEIENEGGTGEE